MKIDVNYTTVHQVEENQANQFIRKYHLKGVPSKFGRNRYDFGLFYKGDLVCLATFCNSRTPAKAKVYQQELVRLTFKDDVIIKGSIKKLIDTYILKTRPRNFFVYASPEDDHPDVFKQCRMKSRRLGAKHKAIVKDGYNFVSALFAQRDQDKKFLYLDSSMIRLGPTDLLGINLKGKFKDSEKLSNRQLFIKYCGYHEEVVDAKRLYDFNNLRFVHYIYKITNDDPLDHQYYIGRHSDYRDDPNVEITEDDMINDGYWGSGGTAYKNWKRWTASNNYSLVKEILAVYYNWTDEVKAEKDFVGTAFKDDPDCLNQVPGGTLTNVTSLEVYRKGRCPKHGATTFRNGYCCKCSEEKALHMANCPKHGRALFNGTQCYRCQSERNWHIGDCPVHGHTLFCRNTCAKCASTTGYVKDKCSIHGWTQFTKKTHQCKICILQKNVANLKRYIGDCPIHGKTKFYDGVCMKCAVVKSYHMGDCPIHGHVMFHGDSCVVCVNNHTVHMAICLIHGLTKFEGDKCMKCNSSKSLHMGYCPKHGYVKFAGKTCLTCKNRRSIMHKYCAKCGKVTGWNGNRCMSCVNRAMYKLKKCPVHGLTKFRGKTCMKCSAAKRKAKRLAREAKADLKLN